MSLKSKFYHLTINATESIHDALKLMDNVKHKLLIVLSEERYVGLVSIGDIQRAIINNIELTVALSKIMRNDYIVATPYQKTDEIKSLMLKIRAEFMPVVDEDSNLVDVFFWEDLFGKEKNEPLFKFNLPVVIMAGGLGTRMRPLTYVLPKPLLPFGEKSLIEGIFNRFKMHGCEKFYISVNYKADLIEYYLNQQEIPFKLNFFREEKPMGTGGSLALLKGKIKESFFVTNCDILIDQDYSEVLQYHNENKNEITIVAALKHFPISYGTIETGENGQLLKFIEKPQFTLKINSGMYILEPHLLDEIPEDKFFHITQLIENVSKRGGHVGVFPVSEKSWRDIGDWDLFLNENKILFAGR